jgi:hypothetical protein
MLVSVDKSVGIAEVWLVVMHQRAGLERVQMDGKKMKGWDWAWKPELDARTISLGILASPSGSKLPRVPPGLFTLQGCAGQPRPQLGGTTHPPSRLP